MISIQYFEERNSPKLSIKIQILLQGNPLSIDHEEQTVYIV